MDKLTIIGNGSWGTALALTLRYNYKVTLLGLIKEEVNDIIKNNENSKYLPGHKLDNIKVSNDISESFEDTNIIINAVPTKYIRQTFSKLKNNFNKNIIIVSVSKGIEHNTFYPVTKMLEDELSGKFKDIVALSGPSHAEEVAKKIPTAVVIASLNNDSDLLKYILESFKTDYFRLYSSNDIIGVEIGAAVKNIIAISAGISDGLGFGSNTKSALMTRGIVEISRLGKYFKANPETFSGLSGIGDLITTCISKYSRNRYVGEEIAKGKTLADLEKSMDMVAEGVYTCQSVYEIAEKNNIYMPITEAVYNILFKNKNPMDEVKKLMTSDSKSE